MNIPLQQLLQLGQQFQARLSELQQQLTARSVTSTSGGGLVEVTADGRGRIRSVRIDPSLIASGDIEMLEDLLVAAVNDAQARAQQLAEEELRKLALPSVLPFPFGQP